ncbi:hypothetical protein, partial [Pseudonocardia lacus]|uniref:hypothetical protein n=1 Tax=Pseudonocardia lacus TaxID=2835865 RepID=UPI001BDCCD19
MSARADAVLEPRLFADFAVPGTGAEVATGAGAERTGQDAAHAERAWLAGDAVAAIAAADRAL